MCTISAIYTPDGSYCVTMNRDERRSRAAEHAPQWVSNQVLAPLDGEAGGTWFAARPDGCWAALLNGYSKAECLTSGRRSRGELPLLALSAKASFDSNPLGELSDFHSFRLLVGCPEKYVEWIWDGVKLTQAPMVSGRPFMRSSSSYRQAEVVAYRRVVFDQWRATEFPYEFGQVPKFHRDQPKGQETMGVLMSREHSATRSIVQFIVQSCGKASLFYWPVSESQIGDRQYYCLSYGNKFTDEME